jgi:hypothetical protein
LRVADAESPYVVGLLGRSPAGEGMSRVTLVLVDVSHAPAVLVGRHDFDARVSVLSGVFTLRSDSGEPIVLAELTGPGATTACGWLLAPSRPRFLCAPKLSGPSRFDVRQGELLETWEATFPPAELVPSARSGRVLRFSTTAGWNEADGFRCLAAPLDEAILGAGSGALRRWQYDSVRRLARAARRASDTLDNEEAERLLREAIAADACDPEPWRLLGRLQFQRGNAAEGAPALAVAVALASHDAPPLVDLADALVDLETSRAADQEAFARTRKILARPASTRGLAERADAPRVLARSLYELYLERTAGEEALHQARRRRVEAQLQILR